MSDEQQQQSDADMKPVGMCTVQELYNELQKRIGTVGGSIVIAMEVQTINDQTKAKQHSFTADIVGSFCTCMKLADRLQLMAVEEERLFMEQYLQDRASARRR